MIRNVKSPILIIGYNRPQFVKRLILLLENVYPNKIYLAVDGPRHGNKEDMVLCEETQQVISMISWKCKIYTLFQKKNLGCRKAPVAALDWFFGKEKEGIILEDDIVPDLSFFQFCDELLEKYRNDERIGCISGSNFLFGNGTKTQYSYYFSRYPSVWGWASWRRVWKTYDRDIILWPEVKKKNLLSDILSDFMGEIYWKLIFEAIYKGKIQTWDYQFTFTLWLYDRLTIIPSRNLVKNIGFDRVHATHTKFIRNKFFNMRSKQMTFPISHPKFIVRDAKNDKLTQRNNYVLWKELVMNFLRKY